MLYLYYERVIFIYLFRYTKNIYVCEFGFQFSSIFIFSKYAQIENRISNSVQLQFWFNFFGSVSFDFVKLEFCTPLNFFINYQKNITNFKRIVCRSITTISHITYKCTNCLMLTFRGGNFRYDTINDTNLT